MIFRNVNEPTEENIGVYKVKFSDFLPLIPIVAINVFYSVMNYIDVILARRYFTPLESDIFSIASTIAKANLFVIIPISYIVLPRMIEDYRIKGYMSSIGALFKGISLSLISSLLFIGFLAIFVDLVLSIFGSRYLEARGILIPFTLAFIPVGLSFLVVNYSVTFKRWSFVWVSFLANICLLIGFILFHKGFMDMIIVYGIVGLSMFIAMIIMVFFSKPLREKAEEESREKKVEFM